jgi:hypothetical protein
MNYRILTLDQVFAEGEAICHEADALFGHLNARQLNWKPTPESWSVAQCLDHLIAINREYYPTFDLIRFGVYPRTALQRVPVLPALLGRMMITVLSPDTKRRFKAPQVARPAASSIDPSIVLRFIAHQRDLLARMRSLEDKTPESIVITSPFARLMVYSLLDSFRLVVAHERRHFAQARRVTEIGGFAAPT